MTHSTYKDSRKAGILARVIYLVTKRRILREIANRRIRKSPLDFDDKGEITTDCLRRLIQGVDIEDMSTDLLGPDNLIDLFFTEIFERIDKRFAALRIIKVGDHIEELERDKLIETLEVDGVKRYKLTKLGEKVNSRFYYLKSFIAGIWKHPYTEQALRTAITWGVPILLGVAASQYIDINIQTK